MKKNPQKNKVTNAQLRSVAKNNGLQQSLNNLFSASFSPDDDVIRKFNYISSLVGDNIRKSKDSANFDTEDFKSDASTLLNLKMKYEATMIKDTKDLKLANKIYNKHKRLSALMS